MRHWIFDIPFDDLSDQTLEALLEQWLNGTEQKMIITPNPEFVMRTFVSPVFKEVLQKAALSLPDGTGIRFAVAALTDHYLKFRHTGVDTIQQLLRLSNKHKKQVCLVGGAMDSTQKAKEVFESEYPGISIYCVDPGTLSIGEIPKDLSPLQRADVLLVALGQEKQERFIQEILPKIPRVKIAMGIGGALDMSSRKTPRAPMRLRRLGLEWAWRWYLEPARTKRMFTAIVLFPMTVMFATLRQHRFLRACTRVIPEIYRQLRAL